MCSCHLTLYSAVKQNKTNQKRLQQSISSCTIYVLQAPTDSPTIKISAQETIAQMRRLQPRGPYSLFPIDSKAKIIINEILKQLEKYTQVII